MVETRNHSEVKAEEAVTAGEKHKIEHDSPDPKRAKTEKQSTIDEFVVNETAGNDASEKSEENEEDEDAVRKDVEDEKVEEEEVNDKESKDSEENEDEEKGAKDAGNEDDSTENEDDQDGKNDVKEGLDGQKKEQAQVGGAEKSNGSAEEPGEEGGVPSNVLEKGIIYFFMRGRVDIDTPSSIDEIQRTYIVLRPLQTDAKLSEGPIGDAGNSRLLALPKKVFPGSGKDRFMMFVEKAGVSFEELKKDFLEGSDYETKTAGTRHTPAATPVGEGVYAMTSTGRESHLAYMLTLPEKLDDVQQKLGLKEKGSFILSTKNPEYKGPANAQLPEGPEFPKNIMEDFRKRRWMPSEPEHLGFPNAQILLIGESSGIEKATESQDKDKKDPEEVLEHLEVEDLNRMKHLGADDSAAIFKDLEARASDYPKLQTTF